MNQFKRSIFQCQKVRKPFLENFKGYFILIKSVDPCRPVIQTICVVALKLSQLTERRTWKWTLMIRLPKKWSFVYLQEIFLPLIVKRFMLKWTPSISKGWKIIFWKKMFWRGRFKCSSYFFSGIKTIQSCPFYKFSKRKS